ncbi:MAG: hypothetical protein HN725_05170 [Alphaproteobacteria bacterium]|jgi:TfoX/Sxy family transcriptional regulator of competence genes|nr:hypothetical protein [Alphaproteobacteria bacterium]MBT4083752.1 hypothetical protein [Alphaproteobacteria bacterium]MBT4545274.1 hypothetical protein [Alphaproteobacteria bacterium]MBT6385156.1 hypothetical protein [Alphaproteobacteria bacterium]MBT7744662.1 hypothetical protein [Alphaproteobacteria bacterium]
MAQPWLNELSELVEGLTGSGVDREKITCKHFFSGAAAYVGGQIFMSLSPAGLALKLPEVDCVTLMADGGKPLKYFAKSPVKKGYVVLPDKVGKDNEQLHGWISRSLGHVDQTITNAKEIS